MNIRFRLNELLDVVQISVEAVIMSPIIIGCFIERFFERLGEIADDAVWAHENYEKLEFDLREAKNDAWAANLALKDANDGWKHERMMRCKALVLWCDSNVYAMKILANNEVISDCKCFYRNRELWWGKWRDRFHWLENYYKEIDLNGEEEEHD